jgi:hypothetical protein
MEVHGVFIVNGYGHREVLDGLVKVIVSIPNESSAVVAWCVFGVYFNDLIKILESQIELVATYLLSYCAKMMQGRDIGRL